MSENFQKKEQLLRGELQEKAQRLLNIDNIRTQLINEINQIQGKIQLLEELKREKDKTEIKEDKPKDKS